MDEPPALRACRRLWRSMDQFEDACCRRLRINRSDLQALNLLEDGPVSMGALARALGITAGSVTSMVDRLEAAGWVRRVPSETDRRSTALRLQPAAWTALAELYAPVGRAVVASFDELPAPERDLATAGILRAAHVFESFR